MKKIFFLVFLFIAQLCAANMASPVSEGTRSGSAFSSRNIDILNETIRVIVSKDRNTARFIVSYTIKVDSAGKQIPLLFVAQDYKDSFRVWLDGQKLDVLNIPAEYINMAGSPLGNFSNIFGSDSYVGISWVENTQHPYSLYDLKYFETAIDTGIHTINVEYLAEPWTDRHDWVMKKIFRYSLTPAKYWRSFGTLNIIVEQEGKAINYATNLGVPSEEEISAKNSWKFTSMPDEYFALEFKPELKGSVRIIASLAPFMPWIAGIILFMIHLLLCRWYRSNHIRSKFSTVVIIGSLLVPLIALSSYVYSFELADNMLGADASRYHGYTFMIFIFFPLICPIYWLLMWLLDKSHKRLLQRRSAGTT